MKINVNNANISLTVGNAKQFPKNPKPQIALSGRSNVGKSSLYNRVVGRDAAIVTYGLLVNQALEAADILAALPKVSYEGVCGLVEFDEIGDAKRDVAYIKGADTENGVWEFVTVQRVD